MGHDMSLGALMIAARELASETDDDLNVIVLNWLPIVIHFLPEVRAKVPMEVFEKLPKKDGKTPTNALEGHGGAGETGRMLWQHPKLVVTEAIRDYPFENPPPTCALHCSDLHGRWSVHATEDKQRRSSIRRNFRFSLTGTAEVGDGSYDAIADWVATAVEVNCYRNQK